METTHPDWLATADELKQATLDRLAAMPEPQRDTTPKPGTWSASGVVEHLILVEECVGGPWQEMLKTVPGAKVGLKSEFASRMVSFIFAKTGQRVPTVSELEPTGGLGIEELELRWHGARQWLIDSLPTDDRAAWIFHPAPGPLSSSQMGRIMCAHLQHHLRHWPQ